MENKNKTINSYCEYVKNLPLDDIHRKYHDTQYGFPLSTDDELFGRLILEINQAGLSWTTILKKQNNFYIAYDKFNIKKIANYKEKDINRLLKNPGIIRNKLKINAAIYNANQIIKLQKQYGSFQNWLNISKRLNLEEWVKLFKAQFKFVGGEIVNEFLMSIDMISETHQKDCPIYKIIKTQR